MNFTVIGKYGPFPPEGGACSCYLLEFSDKKIVLDMGAGSFSRLMHFVDVFDIDAIFLSHLHFDHMSDIPVFGYAVNAINKKLGQDKKIKLFAPKEPSNIFKLFSREAFDIETINENLKVKLGKAEITFLKMTHPFPSYAIKVDDGEKIFAYSGDTSLNDKLAGFIKGASVALLDANFKHKDKPQNAVHMTITEAAMVAKQANVKKLILTHQSAFNSSREVLNEAIKVFLKSQTAQEMKSIVI